jgi:Ca-activated chloride channel family protein
MINWADFHFLRPLWLMLLPCVVLIYFLSKKRIVRRSAWEKVIEPHLLPYLISDRIEQPTSPVIALLLPLVVSLLILALSGPTVKKLPTDVSFNKAPLIICFEMSDYMLSRDIDPSRLKRAMYKLEDLLKRYQGAEVALIAFAGDAHLVVPLTDDYTTVLSLAKTLTPELMPKKGAHLDGLVTMVKDLMARNPKAKVVIITSTNISETSDHAVDLINSIDGPVTIWAFASELGAPVQSAEGRFEQLQGGEVKISKINKELLDKLKRLDGVNTIAFTPDSRDVDLIAKSMESAHAIVSRRELFFDSWYDLGPYFLAVAMVISLFCFFFLRQQWWLFGVLLLVIVPEVKADGIKDWFLRPDQQAERALLNGDAKKAAELFDDDFRKGSAYYQAKMYDHAIEYLSKVDTSDGHYNLGNAYAQKGQIVEAIQSYDQALKQNPKNEDAKANKELLEKLLKDQQQKQEQKNENQEEKQPDKKEEETKPEPEKNSGDKKDDDKKQSPQNPSSSDNNATHNPTEQKDSSHAQDQQNKEKKAPELKTSEEEKNKTLDNETRYYLDRLGEKNGLYLKRKFRYESEKNRESK